MLRAIKRVPPQFAVWIRYPTTRFSERLDEIEDRKKQRLVNGLKSTEAPQYWVTSARPANFGDPLQVPTKPDNWFDDNRMWNEEDQDFRTRRTKLHTLNAFIYGFWVLLGGVAIRNLYEFWLRKTQWRIKDTYAEFDISGLQPGQVKLATYMGEPIFVRILTPAEVEETLKLDRRGQYDTKSYVATTTYGKNQLLVAYAKTNHGTIPKPLEGKYGGWYCPETGQVFDKFGRVRKDGHKGKNLQYVNHTIHDNVLSLEKKMDYTSNYSRYYI